MYKILRNDIDRLNVLRKEGRGFTIFEDYINGTIATIQRLKGYTKKSKEKLFTAVSNSNGNIREHRKTKARKQRWKKNNCMYNSSDKLVRLHIRWLRKENFEKSNLF